jgi:hypothetical protein
MTDIEQVKLARSHAPTSATNGSVLLGVFGDVRLGSSADALSNPEKRASKVEIAPAA